EALQYFQQIVNESLSLHASEEPYQAHAHSHRHLPVVAQFYPFAERTYINLFDSNNKTTYPVLFGDVHGSACSLITALLYLSQPATTQATTQTTTETIETTTSFNLPPCLNSCFEMIDNTDYRCVFILLGDVADRGQHSL